VSPGLRQAALTTIHTTSSFTTPHRLTCLVGPGAAPA
jgi:hypothetical protein